MTTIEKQAIIKKDISLLDDGENLVYKVRTPHCQTRFGYCWIKHIQSNDDFVFEDNMQYTGMIINDQELQNYTNLGLVQ